MKNATYILSLNLLCAIAILVSGSDRHPATAPPAPAATASTTTPAPTTSPVADVDRSLDAEAYIARGLPSYDREWAGADMMAAAAKLKALAAASPEQLPRFGSARSGAMFARIVSRDNLAFFRSRSLPLASRFPQAIDYIESLNTISKTYLSATSSDRSYRDELVELFGAELRMTLVELELVDEFVPTLSKDDPTYPVRMGGLEKMRRGLAELVSGTLITLTEERYYGVDPRARLVRYCRETLPQIVPRLSAPSQQEMLRRLDDLVDQTSVRDFRDQVVALRDEVRAAVKSAERP